MTAYVALPRYLTTTRTLECKSQAIYLQYSMLIPQMESGFPRKRVSNVHDSGQVCMFQGKNGRNFKAFTSMLSRQLCPQQSAPQVQVADLRIVQDLVMRPLQADLPAFHHNALCCEPEACTRILLDQ